MSIDVNNSNCSLDEVPILLFKLGLYGLWSGALVEDGEYAFITSSKQSRAHCVENRINSAVPQRKISVVCGHELALHVYSLRDCNNTCGIELHNLGANYSIRVYPDRTSYSILIVMPRTAVYSSINSVELNGIIVKCHVSISSNFIELEANITDIMECLASSEATCTIATVNNKVIVNYSSG